MEAKCIPQLLLRSLLGTHRPAIGSALLAGLLLDAKIILDSFTVIYLFIFEFLHTRVDTQQSFIYGRLLAVVQSLTLLSTSCARKGTLFVYL